MPEENTTAILLRYLGELTEASPEPVNVIHLLINNAGIMRPPALLRNVRGHELRFATNDLGHFQLTARLWPPVKNARGARVVTLSSIKRVNGKLVAPSTGYKSPAQGAATSLTAFGSGRWISEWQKHCGI
jgi:NAD(P)-dependent dehydrogenase (short-subunit alcohol dehydrogenase family)